MDVKLPFCRIKIKQRSFVSTKDISFCVYVKVDINLLKKKKKNNKNLALDL